MVAIAASFYFEHLYPLQDDVLQQIAALDTGFYLSGGTASSRGITNAGSKAAGIFPVEVARILYSASRADWAAVKWIDAPAPEWFVRDLQALAETLILNP